MQGLLRNIAVEKCICTRTDPMPNMFFLHLGPHSSQHWLQQEPFPVPTGQDAECTYMCTSLGWCPLVKITTQRKSCIGQNVQEFSLPTWAGVPDLGT